MTEHSRVFGNETVCQDYMPTESQLTLFCLDYLRDLRRTYANPQDMLDAEGLHADWLTLAIYALSRSFSMRGPLRNNLGNNKDDAPVNYNQVTMPVFNDSWMDSHKVLTEASPMEQEEMMNPTGSPPEDFSNLPSLGEMTKQILLSENPREERDDNDEKKTSRDGIPRNNMSSLNSYTWYEYDDAHPSNANRFYLLDGLAGSTNGRGPLLLGEVAAAGLCQLGGKARRIAEDNMIQTPLFEQFVKAVESKGFFEDPEHETPRDDPQQEEERLVLQKAVHDERMGKVVSKFRSKLAAKMNNSSPEEAMTELADYHHGRRMQRILLSRKEKENEVSHAVPTPTPPAPSIPPAVERVDASVAEAESQAEAESFKSKGNAYMQKKKYDAALECYTHALKLSPNGPQSHVYFSNRAAALLSMKKFDEAILDSERALVLAPTYGKAHARLGLAHFLLGDYKNAMESYTVALKYEPDNKSSKSYLEKAAKKLAAMGQTEVPEAALASSYSMVAEWEKANNTKQTSKSKSTSKIDKKAKEAEQHKTLGNTKMANHEYDSALESYSKAIEMSPDGPQSHVYYSNRAAALCYLERYEEAVADSEVAIQLNPTYGKAHARLGLSKFFMNDFKGSISAYKTALKYEPDNVANKSYLAKAQLKLQRQKQENELKAFNTSDEARRLMNDPDMMNVAKKMTRKGSSHLKSTALLSDPEMQKFAKKAMSDPTMLEALQNLKKVDP